MDVHKIDNIAQFCLKNRGNYWWAQKYLLATLIFILALFNLASSSAICIENREVPARPPNVDLGSFTIHQSFLTVINKYETRDIFIFWQNINEDEQCARNFEYLIYCTPIYVNKRNKTARYIHKKKTKHNFAKFRGLKTGIGYNFTIYSININGLSEDHSTIKVPKEAERITKRLSLTKTSFHESGLYELSWTNHNKYKLPDNYLYNYYTLFWCETEKAHPHFCFGYLNWTHVSSSATSFNVSVDDPQKNYGFSLSVNSFISTDTLYDIKSYSSGMIWETCTVGPNKIPGKIEHIQVNFVSSMSFEMHWTLDCTDSVVVVDGYHVYYCPVISKYNPKCTGPMIDQVLRTSRPYRNNTIILDYGHSGQITSLGIKELEALTTYMIHVAVIFKNNVNEGMLSDALFITTEDEDKIRIK